jgi:hypothetical protein
MLDRSCHAPAQQAASEHGADQDVPAPLLYAVEQRADERSEQRERRHRDDQGKRDLAPRLGHRRAEEQGSG